MKKIIIFLCSILLFSSFSLANNSLDEAVNWMYQNGLTKFDNSTDFMTEKTLRRDEASKFFVQYAKEVLNLIPDTNKTSCDFTDLNQARPDLKDLIREACQLGLFQGYNGNFMPTQSLTNAQAITVLIRMIDGKKDETQGHFAQKYFEKAQELGIMNGLNLNATSNFDKLTTRGDVGILIFNSSKLSSNTNTTKFLFPLNLLKNQKREIELTVPIKYFDTRELIFNIKRNGGNFETSTQEKDKITGKIYSSSDKYSAGITYLYSGYYQPSYNFNVPLLEVKYCYYLYEYIKEDYTCQKYYIDANIMGSSVSGTYEYFSKNTAGGVYPPTKLYTEYPIIIKTKSNYIVDNCKYKGEEYLGEKIYHSLGTKEYETIRQFICFETEIQAKAAGYKASLLNP